MNYRHHFHAGNFADVWKHALLVQLVRGMQWKQNGFLFLDTHAGRGRYDLALAARGDTLERKPESPDGIGRLWEAEDLPDALADYLSLVRGYNRRATDGEDLRVYPGSPRLVQMLARPQDRLALCEKHPEEFAALRGEFAETRRVSVHEMDGYGSFRAMLPPQERRALVLIDPPFEDQNEFSRVVAALEEGLRRMPACTIAVWYPLTIRARSDLFFEEIQQLDLPPSFYAEIMVVPEDSPAKVKGCGLLIVNPPWKIDQVFETFVPRLSGLLKQEEGGGATMRWLVPEI